MKQHLVPTRVATMRTRCAVTNAQQDAGKLEPCALPEGVSPGVAAVGSRVVASPKVKHRVTM